MAFDTAWQAQRDERTFDGQERRRKRGGGHQGTFPSTRAKLFFVFYCKCYLWQEVMALLFGLSQGQVSHWVGELDALDQRCSWAASGSCPPESLWTWRSCSLNKK